MAAAEKKNNETATETAEVTKVEKVTIPSVEQIAAELRDVPREHLDNTIKAARKARWDGMSNWQKAGHVALSAAPYVAVAAAAGAGGYYLAGGFSADQEADNVVPLKTGTAKK